MRRRGPVLLALLLLAACGTAGPPPTATREPIVVFAAASLTDVFGELAAAYTDETGVELMLSFDASSALRAQITEGAGADLFASADVANPQELVDEGLTDGGIRRFAANGVALVVPGTGETSVASWADLAADGTRIVAAGEEVPITGYVEEVVERLAALPDAPPGFAEAYASNVVSREDNVRAVLAKIELGEGDAAFVYETDAATSDDVTTVTLPAEADVVADYAFVLLADAPPVAADFADWLLEERAREILAAAGFRPPSE